MSKEVRVKCSVCKEHIHIDDFGGIDKKGVYHTECIIAKIIEAKDES